MDFFKKNLLTISVLIIVLPFSIYMIIIGNQLIDLSQEINHKGALYNEKSKSIGLFVDVIKYSYTQATTYYMIAFGAILLALLLPKLQSISFGGASIVLNTIKNDLNDLKTVSNDIQEKFANTKSDIKTPKDGGSNELVDSVKKKIQGDKTIDTSKKSQSMDVYDMDPQKDQWGGFTDVNGRHIRAEVRKTSNPEIFKVKIIVFGDSDNPLKGLVTFHLHPTFENDSPIIAVRNNVAELNLNSVWGAFTVGAEADNGKTLLELDLSELESAPEKFRTR